MILLPDLGDLQLQRGADPDAAAVFSLQPHAHAAATHRYFLQRRLSLDAVTGRRGTVLVSCGMNPSTANAFRVDPTVRREIGYAISWGCEWYVKVNAYGWQATYPSDMWTAAVGGADIVGAANDRVVAAAIALVAVRGGRLLAAWGGGPKPDRVMALMRLASAAGLSWQCVGKNLDGSPVHPLVRRSLVRGADGAPELYPWP